MSFPYAILLASVFTGISVMLFKRLEKKHDGPEKVGCFFYIGSYIGIMVFGFAGWFFALVALFGAIKAVVMMLS